MEVLYQLSYVGASDESYRVYQPEPVRGRYRDGSQVCAAYLPDGLKDTLRGVLSQGELRSDLASWASVRSRIPSGLLSSFVGVYERAGPRRPAVAVVEPSA